MDKQVIVINGRGGAGKDTLCRLAGRFYRVRNISSITPIAEIARYAGWDGVKTPASRRLLSQLKQAFTEWGDLSQRYCLEQYREFLAGDECLLFVHIREPEEIERFRRAIDTECHTLLVRRGGRDQPLGNRSDDNVAEYAYDYYFYNDGPLARMADSVRDFLAVILSDSPPRTPYRWHFD